MPEDGKVIPLRQGDFESAQPRVGLFMLKPKFIFAGLVDLSCAAADKFQDSGFRKSLLASRAGNLVRRMGSVFTLTDEERGGGPDRPGEVQHFSGWTDLNRRPKDE